jgi:hypothetical protein
MYLSKNNDIMNSIMTKIKNKCKRKKVSKKGTTQKIHITSRRSAISRHRGIYNRNSISINI